MKKRWIAAGVAVALVLGLTACGGKDDKGTTGNNKAAGGEELAPEYSYVAKYGSISENFSQGEIVFNDKSAYCIKTDYENEKTKFLKADVTPEGLTNEKTMFELDGTINAYGFSVDDSENVYLVNTIYPEMPSEEDLSPEETDKFYNEYEQNPKNFLQKYDSKGEVKFEVDLKEFTQGYEYFYPQYLVSDDKQRCYLYSSETGVLLFDENGKPAGKIEINDQNCWVSGMGVGKDGKVYASYQSYGGDSAESCLAALDFEGRQVAKTYKNFVNANGTIHLFRGRDADLICSDGTGMYEYSLEKEEATKLLTWLDVDVAGNMISAVFLAQDGIPYVIVNDYGNGDTNLVSLSKVKTEDIVKRTIITVGSIYEDSDLAEKIIKFNKENDQYRVKLKTYMDLNDWSDTSYTDAMTNLMNDVISGNGPDILDLSNLDVENLAAKGALADLGPYLEKSSKLNKSDFFDRILEAATFDGVLTYVAKDFLLQTLVGKTSIVGDKMGWTLRDVIALSKQYPKAELLSYATKDTILQMMLMLNKSAYIDSAKNECHFDSQEFKDLLTFANSFPEEYDYNNQTVEPLRLKDDSLLLADAGIYNFEDVQSIVAYFDGEPCTFIGYPGSDGGNGCILTPREMYGISSKSANKDAAWTFLEGILTEEESEYHYFGFSTQKARFAEQKKKALEVEYVYDENGEIMRDEYGDPIYEGGSGYSMIGDDGQEWTYNYKPVTQEEVDMVEKLLAGASIANLSYDVDLYKIISEEAQSFFKGSKSVDEVANVIQNRVNLYLKENN